LLELGISKFGQGGLNFLSEPGPPKS